MINIIKTTKPFKNLEIYLFWEVKKNIFYIL